MRILARSWSWTRRGSGVEISQVLGQNRRRSDEWTAAPRGSRICRAADHSDNEASILRRARGAPRSAKSDRPGLLLEGQVALDASERIRAGWASVLTRSTGISSSSASSLFRPVVRNLQASTRPAMKRRVAHVSSPAPRRFLGHYRWGSAGDRPGTSR